MKMTESLSKVRLNKNQSLTMQMILQIILVEQSFISQNDLKMLVHLAEKSSEKNDPVMLRSFCEEFGPQLSHSEEKALQLQYVRNRISAMTRRGYIDKTEKDGLKRIAISKKMSYIDKTNHLLKLNFFVE